MIRFPTVSSSLGHQWFSQDPSYACPSIDRYQLYNAPFKLSTAIRRFDQRRESLTRLSYKPVVGIANVVTPRTIRWETLPSHYQLHLPVNWRCSNFILVWSMRWAASSLFGYPSNSLKYRHGSIRMRHRPSKPSVPYSIGPGVGHYKDFCETRSCSEESSSSSVGLVPPCGF